VQGTEVESTRREAAEVEGRVFGEGFRPWCGVAALSKITLMGTNVVLAAIDDSDTAGVVLATAAAFAKITDSSTAAVHVREGGVQRARASAAAAHVPLHVITGDVIDSVVNAAADPDVRAVVIGTRREPDHTRPAGHVTFALLDRIHVPLVVVPPDVTTPEILQRMLVPLDGTRSTARRARTAIDLAVDAGLEVIAIHVCDLDHIPMFTDQPQHETPAFAREFLARYAPGAPVHLEMRVGPPADELLAATSALSADLVAIAWAQTLEPGRAQVVQQLLTCSRVPLLLLPLDTTKHPHPPVAPDHPNTLTTTGSRSSI
jgi:nucleotide-binding universal stress UspA family protein